MKWKKNRGEHSATVVEALVKNQGRVPELLDDLYKLATDDKASRKEKMEAIKFLVEKAVPKSPEVLEQGVVYTADDLCQMNRIMERAIREEAALLAQYWPEVGTGEGGNKPVLEIKGDSWNLLDKDGHVLHRGP